MSKSENFNVNGFEVSRQIVPSKTFPHQPDSFFASEAVKDSINHDVVNDQLNEMSKNVIECFINLTMIHRSTPEETVTICGILQACSKKNLDGPASLSSCTYTVRCDLEEAFKTYVKYANGSKIQLTGISMKDVDLNVFGAIDVFMLSEIDYQRNLTNIVLTFENTYRNEQLR